MEFCQYQVMLVEVVQHFRVVKFSWLLVLEVNGKMICLVSAFQFCLYKEGRLRWEVSQKKDYILYFKKINNFCSVFFTLGEQNL